MSTVRGAGAVGGQSFADTENGDDVAVQGRAAGTKHVQGMR